MAIISVRTGHPQQKAMRRLLLIGQVRERECIHQLLQLRETESQSSILYSADGMATRALQQRFRTASLPSPSADCHMLLGCRSIFDPRIPDRIFFSLADSRRRYFICSCSCSCS
jgi:hypothetical protein